MIYFLRVISFLIYISPRFLLTWLAKGLAFLTFDLLKIRREVMLKNLDIAFPDEFTSEEKKSIARKSLGNFAMTGLEFLEARTGDIARDVTGEGEHHLYDALKEGKGVYILCMHLGNWEAMGAYMTRNMVPSHVLVKPVGGDGLNQFVTEQRAKNRFLWVKRKKKGDGFSAIKEILGRNEVVGFVMDQSRPSSPRLPFFSQSAKTNTSFAAIWQKIPAPIVPAYAYRSSFGVHTVKFFPELKLSTSENLEEDILQHSTLFNQVVESCVRQAPEQYFWLHNRWK